jgi:Tol biopolymer transport system component
MKFRAKVVGLFAIALSAFALAAVGDAQASFPGFNGRIAFERGDHIYTINPDGSQERLVTRGVDPDWSPDGSQITFARDNDIYIANANGSGERRVTTGGRRSDPAWSPDGLKIAFTYDSPDGGWDDLWGNDDDIRVIRSSDGSEINRPANSGHEERHPAWSPDGTKIAYAHYDIWSLHDWKYGIFLMDAYDGANKQRLSNAWMNLAFSPEWSPDGNQLVYTGTDFKLYVRSVGSGLPRELQHYGLSPSWAPGGNQIVFEHGGQWIYVMNAAGGGERQLTYGRDPDWQRLSSYCLTCWPIPDPPLPPKR